MVFAVQTVLRTWSHSSIATTLRTIKHKMPFSKEATRLASNCPVLQENIPLQHAGHQKVHAKPSLYLHAYLCISQQSCRLQRLGFDMYLDIPSFGSSNH